MIPRWSLVIVLGLTVLALAPNTQAQQPGVRAESGGVAIGGSVSGSTINIGIPPEQLEALIRQSAEHSETQKKLITELESKLDLNQRQVRATLDILGEKDIPSEGLAAKLVEVAERFKLLQATALTQPGDDAKVASLRAEAQKAIDAGDLAQADALLAQVESEQRRMLDRLAANAAETAARRGDIALTRLRYREAAQHFANAAAALPADSTRQNQRIHYLQREADALYRQGHEFGDNGALLSAVEHRRLLLSLMPRERAPLDWAATQNSLGVALQTLGERETGTAKLEDAVAAYRQALKEYTSRRTPFDWAATQNNLGTALQALGDRESGTAKLEKAVAAYRDALTVYTADHTPLDWAATQNNLGVVLQTLGERETGTVKLEDAVAAYRQALKEYTPERTPFDWAATQNNLGNALTTLGAALQTLGNIESGSAKLKEAVVAFHEALKERTRARVPLAWAATQSNLGNALQTLGDRETGTAKLEDAVAAYRQALKEYTPERDRPEWAKVQHNLGNALTALGEREGGTARLEEAVAAFNDALKGRTRDRVPLNWARSTGDQGSALRLLAERRGDLAIAERAVAQISTAFELFHEAHHARNAAIYEAQLPLAQALVERLRRIAPPFPDRM